MMRKSWRSYIVGILSILTGWSCSSGFDCLETEGDLVVKAFPLSDTIYSIYLAEEINVFLKSDTIQQLEIEFPSNYMKYLVIKVEDGTLSIRNNLPCKWARDQYAPAVYASLPDLRHVDMHGYSNVTSMEPLQMDELSVYAEATGDLDLEVDVGHLRIQNDYISDFFLSGRTDFLSIYTKNAGRILAEDIMAEKVKITHTGDNDVHISPIYQLYGSIEGYGNVYLHHIPDTIQVEQNGLGELVKLN